MGIIAKQSIKNLSSSYLGFIIGGIYTAILVPKFFYSSLNEWGSAKLLLSYALILVPWVQVSIPGIILKFFPNQSKKENSELLSLIIFWLIITVVLSSLIVIFFPSIFYNENTDPLISQNIIYILPLLYGAVFFEILSALSKTSLKSVFPVFLKEIVLRFYFLIIIILYGFKIVGFDLFLFLFSVSYIIILIPLLIITLIGFSIRIKLNLANIFSTQNKPIYKYAFFLLLNSGAAVLLLNIDNVMINGYIGPADITIYTTWFFLASILLLPSRSISSIAYPVISTKLAQNELPIIETIYKKTSITSFVFALLLFILLLFNIDLIAKYFGELFYKGRYVFLFIALGNLANTISSVNGTIITLSKYYRFDFIFQSSMILTVIITNIIFIPIYGILGAAIASSLSILLINIARLVFVYKKFKIHPFSLNSLKILIIGILSVSIIYFVDYNPSFFNNSIISALFSISYIILIYKLKISEDYNSIIDSIILKIKGLI